MFHICALVSIKGRIGLSIIFRQDFLSELENSVLGVEIQFEPCYIPKVNETVRLLSGKIITVSALPLENAIHIPLETVIKAQSTKIEDGVIYWFTGVFESVVPVIVGFTKDISNIKWTSVGENN